jgi:hypothetical protein
VCEGPTLIGRLTPRYRDRGRVRTPQRRGRFPAGGAGEPAGEIHGGRLSFSCDVGYSAEEAGGLVGKRQSKFEYSFQLLIVL